MEKVRKTKESCGENLRFGNWSPAIIRFGGNVEAMMQVMIGAVFSQPAIIP
jgi:hypothetical protein